MQISKKAKAIDEWKPKLPEQWEFKFGVRLFNIHNKRNNTNVYFWFNFDRTYLPWVITYHIIEWRRQYGTQDRSLIWRNP